MELEKEVAILRDKVKELNQKLFLKELIILTNCDKNYSHIKLEFIDEEGMFFLENIYNKYGVDGLKI